MESDSCGIQFRSIKAISSPRIGSKCAPFQFTFLRLFLRLCPPVRIFCLVPSLTSCCRSPDRNLNGRKPMEFGRLFPSLRCLVVFFMLLEHEPSLSMLECSATKHRDASATNRQICGSPGSLSLVLFFWVLFSDIQINIPLGYLRPPAGSMIFAVDGGRDKE